ncbi:MAG: tail fiber domain-containing protein, partial [Candidatus Omnitrophica bacterium]|nr:tail fiber domain-containing protein [Candidatus Omnitrophota bacterium]
EPGLDKIKELRPVKFKWNADTSTPNFEDIGLIAEEVDEVFPELVSYDNNGRPNNVRYNMLSVVLLKEMQSQQSQIEEQHAEFSRMKTELETLKQQNEQLQKQVEKLLAKIER